MRPPVGNVALLFTDIEGSTRLARELGDSWAEVLAVHHGLVGDAIAAECGYVDGTEGDAFFATFADPTAAVRAAVAGQRALRAQRWDGGVGELRVRMGLHVGAVRRAETGYVGLEVHRAARVAAAAHGGQLLLSDAARGAADGVVGVEALGLHRLKDFPGAEALWCAVIDGRGADAFPPPRTAAYRPNNLPARERPLVGRDAELARVRDTLDGERLVTLTGRGGVGKTSLALAVAQERLDVEPAGVWWTSLAAVTDASVALLELAAAIGATEVPGLDAIGRIAERLRGRGEALVVLDNAEHLPELPATVAGLLDAIPELRLLVTSQVALGLVDEYRLPVETLAADDAVALLEREAVRRGVAAGLLAREPDALLDVVRLLDGLPLALELAAARLTLFSPAQLADRLATSTEVLRGGPVDRPERQRSLRATIEWTLSLLDDNVRAMFVRFGVFAGPVELGEVEAVLGEEISEEVSTLLDVAVLRRLEPGDGRVLLGLPEAICQYADGELAGAPDANRWRLAHARRQAEIVWAARATGDSPWADYRRALDAETEMNRALDWARTGAPAVGRRLGAAWAAMLVDVGRVPDAITLLDALPGPDADGHDRATEAQALHSRAYAYHSLGRGADALALVDRVVQLAADPQGLAKGLMLRGLVHLTAGDGPAALTDTTRALEVAGPGNPALYSGILLMEAQARMFTGDLEGAHRSLEIAEWMGSEVDTTRLRDRHAFRAAIAMHRGDLLAALDEVASAVQSAHGRGSDLHVQSNLASAVEILAILEYDTEAVELFGLLAALTADVLGPAGDPYDQISAEKLRAAEARLGESAAATRTRGFTVPAGMRLVRANELLAAARISSTEPD